MGVVSGEFLRGNDSKKGVGVTGLIGRSWLTVAKGTIKGEVEVGTQFRVCRFENLGIMDSICRYKDYQSKMLINKIIPA